MIQVYTYMIVGVVEGSEELLAGACWWWGKSVQKIYYKCCCVVFSLPHMVFATLYMGLLSIQMYLYPDGHPPPGPLV